jgi:hypothetical protein
MNTAREKEKNYCINKVKTGTNKSIQFEIIEKGTILQK